MSQRIYFHWKEITNHSLLNLQEIIELSGKEQNLKKKYLIKWKLNCNRSNIGFKNQMDLVYKLITQKRKVFNDKKEEQRNTNETKNKINLNRHQNSKLISITNTNSPLKVF